MAHGLWSRMTRRCARIARAWRTSPDGSVEVRREGLYWRLREISHIDRELLERGEFEAATTKRLRGAIKPGMNVIDVGANFGYFTLLMAKLVGETGHVWAFEPTRWYRDRLMWHLEKNGLSDRVTVVPVGLSDSHESARAHIGVSSATLHPMDDHPTGHEEVIELRRLDDVVDEMGIEELAFIKVDTDGHEPAFLRGASKTLARWQPAMVIEFFQGNLDQAGSDVREQKALLESFGYELHSDQTGRPFPSRAAFLKECGNFTHSVNVWAWPKSDASSETNGHGSTVTSARRAVA